MLGLEGIIAGDRREGAEEEVAGVDHDGGAAGSDLVVGLALIDFAERMVDVGGGAEFLVAMNVALILASLESAISELQALAWSCLAEP